MLRMNREELTFSTALIHAQQIVGGTEALARRLQVPTEVLLQWLDGQERPSTGIVLKVMDILIEERNSRSRTN